MYQSTVVPDLYNKELQDSYGVKTPNDLLYALVDDPGEYSDLCVWIQQFQGFTETLDDRWKKQKTNKRRGLGRKLCLLCPS